MMPNKRKRDLIEQDKNSSPIARARGGEIILYNAPDGTAKLDVQLEHDTAWLNLDQMSTLFERDKSVISRHLRKVFADGELERSSVVAKNATTAEDSSVVQDEGGRTVRRTVRFYNLDVAPRSRLAALVATTLLIAESKPDEKDVIVRIVTNLLTERPKGTVS